MKKIKRKLLSFLVSLLLIFNTICPVFAATDTIDNSSKLGYLDGQTPKGYITLSVEKFTIGLGYIQEPIIVPFYEGDNGAQVLDRVLGTGNYSATGNLKSSFYLSRVKDNDYRVENIPTFILENMRDDPTGRKKEGWLGERDYTIMSGWMYMVNNKFPNVGAADYKPVDGDVMRWQFTTYGYGADLGQDGWGGPAYAKAGNKDKLTTAVAKINSSDDKSEILKNIKVRKAYENANKVLQVIDSTQEDIDNALKKLNNSLIKLGVNDNIKVLSPSLDKAISTTGDYMIKNVPEPNFGTNAGEWTILSLARGNIKVPEKYYDDYYNRIEEHVKSVDGVLDKRKYTEYSRLILALSAIGKDATNVAGYNLVKPLADYKQTIYQGINGPIFALIALDTRGYDMDKAPEGKEQATREKYIDYILSKEIKKGTKEAGGWALFGNTPDPDITAMALQALAPYKDDEKIAPYIERALSALSKLQQDNGGYSSWGSINSESIAQVIVALCSLGIDPTTDSRFIKEKNWLVSEIMEFYCEGGGFRHTLDGKVNAMATDQAMYALVAYQRFLQGKNSLYDMKDVIDMSLEDITLQKEETRKLEIKSSNPIKSDVYWVSDNDKVATVSQDGTVEAVGAGSTKIYAYVNGQVVSCKVNVESKLTGVHISKEELTITLNNTSTITAAPIPGDATEDTKVTWKSEDEKIATVDEKGLIKAVGVGTTNITAKIGKFTATCKVTVNIPVTKVKVTPDKSTIVVGKTIKLSATYEPENTTEDTKISWSSSSDAIAKVDKDGVVTGKKAGTTNIYAKIGTRSSYCKVTVITPEQEAANPVIEKINAIGEVTKAKKPLIEEARKAYDALTDEQKKYVTNIDVLKAAEEKIININVEEVKKIIAKIPDKITLKDEQIIKEARNAYNNLDKKEQEKLNSDLINNESKIKNAEEAISNIKAVNKAFVDKVTKAISDIKLEDKFNEEDKANVLSAKSMYDLLSDDQKSLIDDSIKTKLNKDIEKIKELEINNFVGLVEKINRPAQEEDLDKSVEAITTYSNMDKEIKQNDKVKSTKSELDKIVKEIGKDSVNKEAAKSLIKDFNDLKLPLNTDRSDIELAKTLVINYKSLNKQAKKYFDSDNQAKETYNKVISNLELVSKADEFDNKVKNTSLIVNNRQQLKDAKLLIDEFEKLDKDIQSYSLMTEQINILKDAIIKGEEDSKVAKKVENLIDKLPSKITKSDYDKIKKVKEQYDKLSNAQKNYVQNIKKLNEALSKIKKDFDNGLYVNDVKYESTKITGKGQGGAKVEAYVNKKLIGSAKIKKDGTYSIKISKQKGGTKIIVKMTKDGYFDENKKITVLKQIKTFKVDIVRPNTKIVTGKGLADATVNVYLNNKLIGKGIVNKKGKFSIKIPSQKLYTKLTIKITKSGYCSETKNTTVLNVFSKSLTVNKIKSTSRVVTGKGESKATIKVYVKGKQIGKTSKVDRYGNYSVIIPKQKKNTKIKVVMSKSTVSSVYKEVVVK